MVHKLQIRYFVLRIIFVLHFVLISKEKEEDELCKLVYCKIVTKKKKQTRRRNGTEKVREWEEKVNKAIEKRFAYQANAVWHLVYFAVWPFASVGCWTYLVRMNFVLSDWVVRWNLLEMSFVVNSVLPVNLTNVAAVFGTVAEHQLSLYQIHFAKNRNWNVKIWMQLSDWSIDTNL